MAYWQGHSGEVVTVQFCPLETSVYSVGCDDKVGALMTRGHLWSPRAFMASFVTIIIR